MHLASLRKILEYDEELGPTLTVIGEVLSQLLVLLSFFKVLIEIKDATASKKWAKDQARLQKQQRGTNRVARVASLLTHWRCTASAITLTRRSPLSDRPI